MSISIPGLNGRQFKIKLSKLFFPLLIFVIVVIVFVKFSEIKEIGKLFQQAKWYFLLLAFCSQALNYFIQGMVYNKIFRNLGIRKMSLIYLIKSGIMIIFLNYTIPFLGIAGHINFFKILKKTGIQEGKALLVILVEVVCYYFAFILLLLLSFFYLFFKLGHIGYTQIVAGAGFGLAMIILVSTILFFLGNKKRAKKRALWFAEKVDYFEDGIKDEKRIHQLLNDFYADFHWLKENKSKIAVPVVLQFIKFLSDGLTIFFIFLSFGVLTPIGLGIVAFAFGRLFGLVSFIPGGLGAFEGSMVLIFNSLGIQLELALAVMLIYRFFSYWLYFPLGVIFYRQLNSEKSFN